MITNNNVIILTILLEKSQNDHIKISDQAYTTDKLINAWNEEFPDFTLEPDDLKKPRSFIEALVQLFNRLGIVKDFVLTVSIKSNQKAFLKPVRSYYL